MINPCRRVKYNKDGVFGNGLLVDSTFSVSAVQSTITANRVMSRRTSVTREKAN